MKSAGYNYISVPYTSLKPEISVMYRIRLSLTCSLWLCSSELHTVYNASFPLCGVSHQIGRNSSSSGIATVCSIVCDMCKAGA